MSFEIRKITDKNANENCTVAIHSSGLKVYLNEKPHLNINYAVFGTHYGSVDTEFSLGDAPKIQVPEGIAHFLEHKLFEGEDGDAFEKYAVTGASANAYTSFDRTCYLFSCSERFYENLDILLSFVSSPYFTPETVQKEQGIIGQEIRMYEDVPDWRVLFNLLRGMYHNHPVNVEIAGTVESIAEITDKTLYDCYNTFYNPSNMFVALSGNFDCDKVLEIIDQKIKPRDTAPINRSQFSEPDSIVKPYTEQKMAVAMPLFAFGIKDNVAKIGCTLKQKLQTEMLLDTAVGKISPLYSRLLNEGLINSRFGTEFFYGHGYSALLFEGESKDPKAVTELIKAEIKKIAQNGIDPDLFQDARRNLYGQQIRALDDPEGVVDDFLLAAICGYEPYDTLNVLRDMTAEDITERAKELDLENTSLSVILPL
ncbi:MAG: insulinase family protein [Clostridia bacterium]|nr:insulinase family protein [Clostridia bacterium]